MLPSAAELRERVRSYMDAARNATDTTTKQRLSACAFVMAQVAQLIERDPHGANANANRLARVIVEALNAVREAPSDVPLPDAITAKQHAISDVRVRIERWRRRAEELRTTADHFVVPSAQESLSREAANYDQMADHAEALLTGKKAPGEKTG